MTPDPILTPRPDPDVLWAAFSNHVRSCPDCTDAGECPTGKRLGDEWYRADLIAAQEQATEELALMGDGTVDRDEA